eukprot:gnl/Spiro4/16146_TR8681_c0_g1_i1.p1 gnl/Spiro4/16146_TR8681_c0_g1~~gnl/Spiro4/16146_TR8681_c0_g1_i1.p1  ORF type:complete len:328 (+),score=83.07 gnl/Spiro4/16146_TR8681_c0_g1_i1:39-1022(+)
MLSASSRRSPSAPASASAVPATRGSQNELPERVEALIIRLRGLVQTLSGFRDLANQFAAVDSTHSNSVSLAEFRDVVASAGMRLTPKESLSLVEYFSAGPDRIAYFDFISALRGVLSDRRIALIRQAFNFLDPERAGRVPFSLVRQRFNAPADPEVRCGRKTADQATDSFVRSWRGYYDEISATVTLDDFLDYYRDVSASCPSDEQFVQVLSQTFRIGSLERLVSEDRINELERSLIEKIWQKSARTYLVEHLRKTFKFFDKDNDGIVDFSEFCATVQTYGVYARREELQALFARYDRDFSHALDFNEFITALSLSTRHRQFFLGQV